MRAWLHRYRQNIIEFLGGKCAMCPETENLEFDHIDPNTRTWAAQALSRHNRLARYAREAKEGKLQLLCGFHNKVKGARDAVQLEIDQPF